jgi:methyl-accepting chemotaxis protein
MDSMTQQNAALVEEAAAAAQSLQDQAAELSRVVSIFKLVEGEERVVAAPPPIAKAVVKPIVARAPVKKLASSPAPAPAAKPKKVASAASTASSDEWEEF